MLVMVVSRARSVRALFGNYHDSSKMMKTRILHVLIVTWQFLGSLQLLLALRFSPVTQEIGLSNIVGRIAAFADFNADKVTDVLVLNSTGV